MKAIKDEQHTPLPIFRFAPGGRERLVVENTANRSSNLLDATNYPGNSDPQGAVLIFCSVAALVRQGTSAVAADSTDSYLPPGLLICVGIDSRNTHISVKKLNSGDADGTFDIMKLR